MKALAGVITINNAAYAYFSQFNNALPILGVQREKYNGFKFVNIDTINCI